MAGGRRSRTTDGGELTQFLSHLSRVLSKTCTIISGVITVITDKAHTFRNGPGKGRGQDRHLGGMTFLIAIMNDTMSAIFLLSTIPGLQELAASILCILSIRGPYGS